MASRGWEKLSIHDALALARKHGPLEPPASTKPIAIPRKNFNDAANDLYGHLLALKWPLPIREHKPFANRRFKIDLAWPDRMISVEVDGTSGFSKDGEYTQGRHGRAEGMKSDCEKQNLLTLEGWSCFRFTASQVKSGYAIDVLEQALLGVKTR